MIENPAAPKIYTGQFWRLCASSFFFFASFNMIIPELPDYLTALGGGEYKGLIIGLFTVTALISRPFSGRWADRYGRVPIMLFGSTVCLLMGLLYPMITTVAGFLVLRLLHGFSTGFTPTGQTAYLSDIIPARRRGEAVGLLGTAGTIGMAAGPAIGGLLATHVSVEMLFYCSSAAAFFSLIILSGIRETLPVKQKMSLDMFQIRGRDFFERKVWVPSLVMLLVAYPYGAMLTLIPDFSKLVGIENKGLLFAIFTMASLVVRLAAGRASDRYGRKRVLRISVALLALAMVVLGFSGSREGLMVGMTLYGLAHGMTSPTLLAWATDLSAPQHKGRGIASLYIFMEFGIGAGAVMSGLLHNINPDEFLVPFSATMVLSLTAFVFLVSVNSRHHAVTEG